VINEFLQAIQFLTRLPLARQPDYTTGMAGAAVSWYAPTGLIIGVLMVLAGWICSFLVPPFLIGAIVLGVWVAITGALHLDGLGDCGDAWMGAHNPERMLEIMKDTSCGIGAIVAVALVLLLKFSALTLLIGQGAWSLLIFAPVLARISLSLVIHYVPYRRAEGLGSSLQANLNFNAIVISSLLMSLLLSLISFQAFVYGVFACGIAWLIIYRFFIKPIRGATGDVYGALVEVTETLVLVGLVASLN
jgi:adenosylcobinamide-GDP ribazoletransferase